MKFPVSINRLRLVMAIALTLWCAGAGCLLVSYAHGAAMTAVAGSAAPDATANPSEAPASMDGHAGCKAHHTSKHKAPASQKTHAQTVSTALHFEQVSLPATPPQSGAMSCCPLTSGSFVVSTRSHSSDDNDGAAAGNNKQTSLVTNAQPAPPAYPLRLLDQDQTYLRCCVFLI